MVFESVGSVRAELGALRERLDRHFSADTAVPGTAASSGSAGHCAATALIARDLFGGELVSTFVGATSHWFNRLAVAGGEVDVDITGDQFGFDRVRTAPAGTLFKPTKVRRLDEVRDETLLRAATLAARAGLVDAESRLRAVLRARGMTSDHGSVALLP